MEFKRGDIVLNKGFNLNGKDDQIVILLSDPRPNESPCSLTRKNAPYLAEAEHIKGYFIGERVGGYHLGMRSIVIGSVYDFTLKHPGWFDFDFK